VKPRHAVRGTGGKFAPKPSFRPHSEQVTKTVGKNPDPPAVRSAAPPADKTPPAIGFAAYLCPYGC
jgi:hypothetical protein